MADARLDAIRLRPAARAMPSVERACEEAGSLTRRIRHEFEEVPGTCLTVRQACRLFSMPADVGTSILRQLVDEGVLRVTRDGRYRLRSPAA